MPMNKIFHLAQVNVARALAPLDSRDMAGFIEQLDEINALAEQSPGFVWRLKSDSGNATDVRPYEDDRIIVNLSVWQSIEQLHDFVYKSAHAPVMRRRQEWFSKFEGAYLALWWVPARHQPSIDEAKARLAHLDMHGPSPFAFNLKTRFPAVVREEPRLEV